MIFKSFLLGNLVSLCMKIINSVVVVGLYYGFLTTFSIGPSYLFLLRAQVMEGGEEGTQKKVSAATGFITGQLMMFISIYYAPLHLALGRPHTITVLALPYLLFHFFWNNHKHFFDYGSTTINSMRNLSIQCVFLNNLIFQLFNHFILPSSMLARLVNIYMFRSNNKMLFVTSSFVGCLIGPILFMKWVGLVLVWIRQNHSIRSNLLIRSNKYLVSELRNSMARIFSIFLFITCVYYLDRIPSPILTKKLKETPKTEERDVETTYETRGIKQEQEGSTEEDTSPSLFSEEKEDPDKIDETEEIRVNGKEKTKDEFHFQETCYKNSPIFEASYLDRNQESWKFKILEKKKRFWFEKTLLTLLFDYNRWNRPFRYIKNNRCENAPRNKMSQYFFYTCQNDGKEKILFTYPPSLSTFFEMIEKRMSLSIKKKLDLAELYKVRSIYSNKEKIKNIYEDFKKKMDSLDKGSIFLTILEKKIQICNDETKKEYFFRIYDPLLNGSHRGAIKKKFLLLIRNQTLLKSLTESFCINKIHTLFFINTNYQYQDFEEKLDILEKTSFSPKIKIFFSLMSELDRELKLSLKLKKSSLFSQQKKRKIESKYEKKILKFLFNAIRSNANVEKKKLIEIKEIKKKIPRWSYKLIKELDQQETKSAEEVQVGHQIRSRKFKRVVIFTDNESNIDINNKETQNSPKPNQISLIRYSQQSDFRRNIIKGSIRAQRKKIIIGKLFQANVHSPLFLDRIKEDPPLFFDLSELMKLFLKNSILERVRKEAECKISEYTEEQRKKEKSKKNEKERIEIAEIWDSIPLAQVIRGFMLITQSTLRKYIRLPSLIIAKNIGRILLLQAPEWSEDFKEWNNEMYVKCTYNGIQLSETEFPKNWLLDGIQIKILFPFCLKPWHRSKPRIFHIDRMKKKDKKSDFCFLTVWGMETELPFGFPGKRNSFFEPIIKELKKKKGKVKKKYDLVLIILKKRTKSFLNLLKKKKKWLIKVILFLKKIKKELSKLNPILLFRLKKVSKLSDTKKEKDLKKNHNSKINESFSQIESTNWTNYLLREKKKKDIIARTSIIRNKIERLKQEKKKRIPEINISHNKTSLNVKRFKLQKKRLKRRNTRVVRKFYYLKKKITKKIYMDFFLSIITIRRINIELFSEKKKMEKYIFNNQSNETRFEKSNKIQFISSRKKSLQNILNKNSDNFDDLASLSQAYVFYKLSQTPALNLYFYKLRPILEYHGTFSFLKTSLKNYFEPQKLFYSKLKQKKPINSEINQWRSWLRSHYQYNFSPITWSRLIAQNCRNRINKRDPIEQQNLNKQDFYEKNHLIYYKKKNYYKVYSLPNEKENFLKYKRYNLLCYRFINYEQKREPSIYGSTFQKTKSSNNYNTNKNNIFEIFKLGDSPIKNFLIKNDIRNMEKNPDRKYFDCKIYNFCLRKTINILTWIKIDIKSNQNTQTGPKNNQIIKKFDKKNCFFLMIDPKINSPNKKKKIYDWMGMNKKILRDSILDFKLWFFPEFILLYNTYKMKPWGIPRKLLFFNLNLNERYNKNKNTNRKQKKAILSNKKIDFELTNQKKKEKKSADRRDLRSNKNNKGNLKDIEENNLESNIKEYKNKKKYKNNTEAEIDLFLKRYLLFQLRWNFSLNQRTIENIKVYCLLLRLGNPRQITLSSIQRKELNLDTMLIEKNLTLRKLIKKELFIIEPLRLSVKNNGQVIMYQTIAILFVQKRRYQGYREQKYVNKGNFDKSLFILKHYQRITTNKDKKNYYLPVPENILSYRRRRELRILICFNSKTKNVVNRNPIFSNGNRVKNWNKFLNENKDFNRDKNQLIKLKLFLWPNYRLEDLACINRYWFNMNNGSRFSMLRIHMYPRLRIY
ncbi:Ycf1 (chloroplast) [Impatiens glandulifera]|uniref:Protein TIC 214 n=1 Tax=Impatiens glandulifera TaxID=253017 RepID=A0A5B9XVW3_9ERIC|nr:Ycf1 [Impatiens glandulifera]QEH58662.1 Ycf1 [Impatiens glandulifera]